MLAKNMIDTHCHIDFPKFDADRQAVLASSLRAGVQKIVVPGVSASQWPKLHQNNKKHQNIQQRP